MTESLQYPARSFSQSGAPSGVHPSVQRKRILIADDSDAFRNVLRNSLVRSGFQVCGEAVDGLDAIEKAKMLQPHLLILDLAMPRLNGVEVASIVKRALPSVPIILLTVYADHVRPWEQMFGVKAIVSKFDPMDKLIDCLRGLLQ